jgi:hypothetical protein
VCTTVVSIDPHSDVPVLLLGVRDEFSDRPWLPPDRHWPECPELFGGQDLQAGGTWLAVQPDAPRVACVLNGHGDGAPDAQRRTRGVLPLRLAADGRLGEFEPAHYDPFHLVCAAPDATRLWSWNGRALIERTLGAGLHVIVNSGLEGADDHDGPGDEQMRARVDYFRPLLENALRPEPVPVPVPESEPRDGNASRDGSAIKDRGENEVAGKDVERAWGAWLPLVSCAGLDPADDRALVLRRLIETRQWGTSSLSLVALTRTAARYDFCGNPTDPRPAWSHIV